MRVPCLKIRFVTSLAFVFLMLGVAFLRLAQLQLFPSQNVVRLKNGLFQKTIKIPSERGAILDARNHELAVSISSYSLYAHPKKIKNAKTTSVWLSKKIKQPSYIIRKKLQNTSKNFVWIKRQLSEKIKNNILKKKIAGLNFIKEPKRVYLHKNLFQKIIGRVNIDSKGIEGVELKYDTYLRGKDIPRFKAFRDARGRVLFSGESSFFAPNKGHNIQLTLDTDIQVLLQNILKHAFKKYEADGVLGIVLDARSSAILASFDLTQRDHRSQPRHRALVDIFEPGSTLKPLVVAGALEANIIKPNSQFWAGEKKFQVGKRFIREASTHHQFQWLSVIDVIRWSSNIAMAKIGLKLGDKKLYSILHQFGLGSKTHVDFPGEAKGILNPLPWRDHLVTNISFGQGIASTALQIANSYTVFANGGTLKKPYLVKEIKNPLGQVIKTVQPKVIRRVLSSKTAEQMMVMLTAAAGKKGTGHKARLKGYVVAGKTGTAQKVDPVLKIYAKKQYISSFSGIFPANDPKYVIYVAIDNPKGKKYYASEVAAPIFAQIAQGIVAKTLLPPRVVAATDLKNKILSKNKKVLSNKLSSPDKKESYKQTQNKILKKILNLDIKKRTLSMDLSKKLHKMPNLIGFSLKKAIHILGQSNASEKILVSGTGMIYKTTPLPSQKIHNQHIKLYLKPYKK